MNTISDIFKQIAGGQDFYIAFGNFLDEFYAADFGKKVEMIMVEPSEFSIPKEYGAFLAATVHKLANDFKLAVPNWVFKDNYYLLDKPFFDCNAKGKLRLLLMYESPAEFKQRNVFVDENILIGA